MTMILEIKDTYVGIAALIVGVIFLSFIIPRRIRMNRLRQNIEDENRKHKALAAREASDGLMVEMSELGRQITNQIDNKISVLKELICQADEIAERLSSASKTAADEKSDTSTHSKESDERNTVEDSAGIEKSEEKTKVSTDIPADTTTKVEPKVTIKDRIYALADEGLNAKEIANKLNEKQGEVELILGLRKREPKDI